MVLAMFAYLLATIPSIRRFTFSQFLYADDNIYLARAAFGGPLPDEYLSLKVIHLLTDLTGSVALGKALPILATALTCGLLVVTFRLAGFTRALAVPLALFLAIYPIDSNVGIFTLGNPAAFTAPLVVSAILLFWRGWMVPASPSTPALAGALALFLAAGVVNPACTLLVLLPPVWVFLQWMRGELDARSSVYAGAIFVVAVCAGLALGIADYHYSGMAGWTDRSISAIMGNVGTSLDYVLGPFTRSSHPARWLLPAAAGLLVCALLAGFDRSSLNPTGDRNERSTGPKVGALCVLLIIASALTLGPGTTVVAFVPRYVTLPFLLVACAGLLLVGRALVAANPRVRIVAAVALALAVLGAAIQAGDLRTARYGPHFATHEAVVDLVERDAPSWNQDAQVVLILPRNTTWPSTAGFNHWSTWYLRLLADRSDISGLIGRADWLHAEPFVEQWQTSGWWSTINGRTTRAKMKGLEFDRPTYVYLYDGSGTWSPSLVMGFGSDERALVIPPGGTPLASGFSAAGTPCDVFAWPVDLDAYQGALAPIADVVSPDC